MYTKVVNPKTGRKVAITSRLGKQIIKNYLNYLRGGRVNWGRRVIRRTTLQGTDDIYRNHER
tara:strand:+ start:3620 stop:3805 length:186 start_codon:yes stop_codon:yes gene_type:complete